MGFKAHLKTTWDGIYAFPLTSCETLGKFLSVPAPQFFPTRAMGSGKPALEDWCED